MTKISENSSQPDSDAQHPTYRLRLPGFIADEDIGLGDAIKRTTSYFGIRSCSGCYQRADALNRWLLFTTRKLK
jgi:hypothetical protein